MFTDEEGAVTVDWVVLTADIVILAIGVVGGLSDAVQDLISEIAGEMQFANISSYF
jgi:Flp pilus assembly pilin Flp